jgi:hypothetical protein
MASTNSAEVRKTLVAFANSLNEPEFAILFIGVAADGNIIGVDGADQIQRKVRQIAKDDCYPSITCDPQVVHIKESKSSASSYHGARNVLISLDRRLCAVVPRASKQPLKCTQIRLLPETTKPGEFCFEGKNHFDPIRRQTLFG